MGRFNIETIFSAKDRASAIIGAIEGRLGKMSRGLSAGLTEMNGITDKILGSLKGIAEKALAVGAVVGTALAAGLMHVIHAGSEFEQKITDVGAVMGKNRSQIADLEKEAMRLGVVTQFSSSQVAEAMEFMARKGFDSGEILAGIPGVLNAVAASGQGMAEVATVVGSAIRGFGLDASEASRVANILAFTAEKTGATITDLGVALSTAAPTAKQLGVSIEDTAAAVGLLQKMGLDASTAGSSVATMLAKISKPSHEAAQEMAALGIKFQDAKGNMLPFRDVLGQFVKAGAKTSGNMKTMAFFAELVGLRGDKAALGLKEMAKSGDFDKLANGIRNTGDYAAKVAAIRLDTTAGSWKLLTSTIEVLETKLFNLKSGALREVIDKMNAWLQANQDLIVSKVQDFIKEIADNLPSIVLWLDRIGKMLAVFGAFVLALKAVTAAMAIFDAVSEANPWVLLAMAIVALIALIYAFWPEISKFFSDLWEGIKLIASDVADYFVGVWNATVEGFKSAWASVTSFFAAVWNGLKGLVTPVLEFIVGLVVLYVMAIAKVWSFIGRSLLAAMMFVVELLRPIWEPVVALLSAIWDSVKADFKVAWDFIVSLAVLYVDMLKLEWSLITGFFAAIWNGVSAAFSAVWQAMLGVAATIVSKFKAIWQPIADFFSGLWGGIVDTFNAIVGPIIEKIQAAVRMIRGLGQAVLGTGDGSGGDGPPVVGSQDRAAAAAANGGMGTGVVQINGAPAGSAISSQPDSGFSLELSPSGGF